MISSSHGGIRYMPFGFTEQGVAKLSNVLKSKSAIAVNISVMRAFVMIRKFALSHKDLSDKLIKLEQKYEKRFKDVFKALKYRIEKDEKEKEQSTRKQIEYK